MRGGSFYGNGNLRHFNVDNLMCQGSESSIFQCRRASKSDCNVVTETAGVECKINYRKYIK